MYIIFLRVFLCAQDIYLQVLVCPGEVAKTRVLEQEEAGHVISVMGQVNFNASNVQLMAK